MITAAVLLVAFRRMRRAFWALLPVAAALIISTVYCRYHYVVDVLAGLALALATVPLGDRLYDHLVSLGEMGKKEDRPIAVQRERS
jgi:membrane-associated phospholipid phosphatase